MGDHSLKGLLILFLLIFLATSSSLGASDAKGLHWRGRGGHTAASLSRNRGGEKTGHGSGSHHLEGSGSNPSPTPKPTPSPSPRPTPKPSPSPTPKRSPSPSAPHGAMFNVLDFGAKGDGVTDDTKAFQDTWAAACNVEASTVVIPSKLQFIVGPVSFTGPNCKDNIVFQLDGMIVAPTSPQVWGSGLLQWLEFKKLKGLIIQGQGTIEGHGSNWWRNSQPEDNMHINTELIGNMPDTRPTALRLYGSYNVTVRDITLQNSPQTHLKFDSCQAVEVFNIKISSPADSPNTDGIHLENSVDVTIHHTDLSCGDDCVSIQTGCSNIYIHNVNCGPGHGISIGGLGRDHTAASVSEITVQDINMKNTLNGVRIKTWQGGSGSVKNIRFSNVQVSEVKKPIVIDQFYCDKSKCNNQTSAVAVSDVIYESIKGTYTTQPVYLACSDSVPCSNIHLQDIELTPVDNPSRMSQPFCWQAYGDLQGQIQPPVNCLQSGKKTKNKTLSR